MWERSLSVRDHWRLCPSVFLEVDRKSSWLIGRDALAAPIRIQNVAEGEGFEPPKASTLVVFKVTFDLSAVVRHSSPPLPSPLAIT